MPEGVADAQAGEAMGLGEGAHPDQARVGRIERRQGAGRRRVGIGLVEAEQAVAGQGVEEPRDRGGGMPGAHRVVGVGEVDERRPRLARRRGEAVEIGGVVAVGHGPQHAAEARDVVVEGRVGAERGDDRGAGRHQQADEAAEQAVDALADHDVLRPDAVVRGDRRPQVVAFRVAVHPGVPGGRGDGGDGARRGAEHALVGAEPGAEGPPQGALLRLGADEGHGGGQARGEGRQAGHGGSTP
jgi:hypothetical protein